jgi:hypothetical protein
MSFEGHVLWNRMAIGPCALTTFGATTAAPTTVALVKNLRRVAAADSLLSGMFISSLDHYPVNIFRRVLFHDPAFGRDQVNP